MYQNTDTTPPVTTAVLLAAGTGSRLYPLTKTAPPKCMTIVNGVSIIDRLISCLKEKGFRRLVIVTGHLKDQLMNYIGDVSGELKIDYVFSPLYKTTNNIYSLWMARNLINEPFMLVESDLIFDKSLLDEMVYPDRIAVADMKPWMNGSCVTIDDSKSVSSFRKGNINASSEKEYKTVNIYSFSLKSWKAVAEQLGKYIFAGKVNDYYEAVFSKMVCDNSLSFDIVPFDSKPWYEIDTADDLRKAEKLFTANGYELEAVSVAV